MAAINSRDEPSWLVAAVSERLSGSTLLLLLHSLPQAAPPGQHLPLNLPKSFTSGSFSCCQSLVLSRLMVRYFWWRQSLGVVFMAPNFPHSIFDPLSCNGTHWIVDKVKIEHSFHSVHIWDIHTARFPLDCSRAAVCPCTLFRVCCRPHSEGCALYTLHCIKALFHKDKFIEWVPFSYMWKTFEEEICYCETLPKNHTYFWFLVVDFEL